jgi:hypothetical protein
LARHRAPAQEETSHGWKLLTPRDESRTAGEAVRLYRDKELSTRQVAARLGLDDKKVRDMLRHYARAGVAARELAEAIGISAGRLASIIRDD